MYCCIGTGMIKTGALKRGLLVFMALFLFACAAGNVQQETDVAVIKKPMSHVDIDPDVKLDFKNAIALMREEKYEQVCKPTIKGSFNGMLEFIREARKVIPEVKVKSNPLLIKRRLLLSFSCPPPDPHCLCFPWVR